MANVNSAKLKILGYKSVLYAVALFLLGIMQTTFFSKINILGATPDLMLGAVLTLSMFDEHKAAAVSGIISGFLYCALGGFSYPLYILFSFLCGYIFWSISEHAFSKNYPSFLALAVFVYAAKGLWNVIEISLSAQSVNLFSAMYYTVIPEFLSSMLFCSFSFVIFYNLSKIFNKKSKSRKDYSVK